MLYLCTFAEFIYWHPTTEKTVTANQRTRDFFFFFKWETFASKNFHHFLYLQQLSACTGKVKRLMMVVVFDVITQKLYKFSFFFLRSVWTHTSRWHIDNFTQMPPLQPTWRRCFMYHRCCESLMEVITYKFFVSGKITVKTFSNGWQPELGFPV